MNHIGTKTIETERLILRRIRENDAEAMFNGWCADSGVTKYLTWQPHKSVEESRKIAAEWAESYKNDDFYHWAIVIKGKSDEPVGTIGAVSANWEIGRVTVGYCLSQKLWNNGYMTEALGAVIDYFIDNVGANRVESYHDSNNPRSGAVMKKCGMKFEGILRQADKNNTGICDLCMYSTIKADRSG